MKGLMSGQYVTIWMEAVMADYLKQLSRHAPEKPLYN
jgi:hypothetical protein